MPVYCNLCRKESLQIGRELFYCRECDNIVVPEKDDKKSLRNIY